jgi:hypothetical protein
MLNPIHPLENQGIELQRATPMLAALNLALKTGDIPSNFPLTLWTTQANLYNNYWAWFRGDVLDEVQGTTSDGKPVLRYPLRINPVRNFSRKHALLLFGEIGDSPQTLVKPVVNPITRILSQKTDEKESDSANFLQALLEQLWIDNHGSGLLMENALLSQFLGGSILQARYEPDRTDLIAPITIRNIYPDFYLPIWSAENYWDLQESYTVYRIPVAIIQRQYNMEMKNTASAGPGYCFYTEHWTKTTQSIYINGEPLSVRRGKVTFRYDKRPHDFGFIPQVYIPRWREGNFYGPSIVSDISGLALEYNARVADEGDAVRKSVHRKRYGRNIINTPTEKNLDRRGNTYIDLGVTNPATDRIPEIIAEDAPQWNAQFGNYKEYLWDQMGRDASVPAVAYGEDEGSQRSALTLFMRMWPSTAIARQQRIFWTDGMVRFNHMILKMLGTVGYSAYGHTFDRDYENRYRLSADWLPMLPRDRESKVSEIIARLQANAIPPEEALRQFGDIPDAAQALEDIKAWIKEIKPQPVEPAEIRGSAGSRAQSEKE